jgi:hypothetical protein
VKETKSGVKKTWLAGWEKSSGQLAGSSPNHPSQSAEDHCLEPDPPPPHSRQQKESAEGQGSGCGDATPGSEVIYVES